MQQNVVRHESEVAKIWARFHSNPSDATFGEAIYAHALLDGAYRDDYREVLRAANGAANQRSIALDREPVFAAAIERAQAERSKQRKAARVASVTPIHGGPSEPFAWVDVTGIFAVPIPEPKWVVPAMELGPGRPCGLWGLGGGGKSWDGMEICQAVASGRKAFGHFDVTQGNVSHVSHELGLRAVRERHRRLANGNGMQLEDFGDRLRISCLPKLFLNTPGAEDHYCRAFEGQSLVLLDSLRRAVPGEDENSSEMSNHLDVMNRVSEKTGASFLVIHHCGKGEVSDKRLAGRGSTAIMDGSGCVWLLEGSGQGPRLMTQIRAHDDGDGECEAFYVEMERVARPEVAFQASRSPVRLKRLDSAQMGEQQAVSQAMRVVANTEKAERTALMLVRDTPGITKSNLEKALVVTKLVKQKAARDLIAELVKRELIAESHGAHNSLTYQLVSS